MLPEQTLRSSVTAARKRAGFILGCAAKIFIVIIVACIQYYSANAQCLDEPVMPVAIVPSHQKHRETNAQIAVPHHDDDGPFRPEQIPGKIPRLPTSAFPLTTASQQPEPAEQYGEKTRERETRS